MKTLKKLTVAIALGLMSMTNLQAQNKETIAILDLHSISTLYTGTEITRLLRSEATKLNQQIIMDVYEMKETFAANQFSDTSCFSKLCGINAGSILKVEKVITGSIERFGEKIIVTLNLIDVKTEKIVNQDVTEYINEENEIQRMMRISISKLLTNKADEQLTRELEYVEQPVSNTNDIISLNGPRMGMSIITGSAARRLSADKQDNHGFDMIGNDNAVFTSTMGFQFEKRYLATNNFQALIEVIPLLSGMEVGRINPSLTFLNGLRFSKSNWEFAIGPTFKIKTVENGYLEDDGTFTIRRDWDTTSMGAVPVDKYQEDVLSRGGNLKMDLGMIIAFGKTFQSGRLNIPVNVYYQPGNKTNIFGVSLGFNIQKEK
jgi:TolB-like protein